MAQKLLLIEENAQLLTLVGDYLSNLGYEVHRASESDEAEALLKNYRYPIVITGTDWENFKGPGTNLSQYIKKLAHHPKVVVLQESRSRMRTAPGDDLAMVIEKPVSLLRLGDLLHKLMSN